MDYSYSRLLFFLCTILIICLSIAEEQPDFLYYFCTDKGNYTDNSTYQTNLQSLLSNISSNTQIDYGFYNFSAGQDSNIVNAIALCRGDVPPDLCRSCIKDCSHKLTQLCPYNKEAFGSYDYCMLRYTNRSKIFGTPENFPPFYIGSPNNVSNATRFKFNEALGNLMADLRINASLGDSRRKFASQVVKVTPFQNIYGLAQCIPDLTELECGSCLDDAINEIPSCCDGKQGGRYMTLSCNIRFETRKFYDSPLLSPGSGNSVPTLSNDRTTMRGTGEGKSSSRVAVIIAVPIVAAVLLLSGIWFFLCRRKVNKRHYEEVGELTNVESLQYDFGTIRAATERFSDTNKLGEGGFGVVYKGRLQNGQEIAVKRLSRNSGQGTEEFKNEVLLVAKLQHRNLVRLLGFCLEGEEMLLIYEFVSNTSLDRFLFDPKKRAYLAWDTRYKIIMGIARGLLYLHEDSRLKIIHRDLKSSNILLDEDMMPKIADFGLAKLFVVDQTQGNTSRIAGTLGYMAPEYAMTGTFSVKSDVFSFGVIVLEIITGQKNSCFHQSEGIEDLLRHAWKLWNEGVALELMDPTLRTYFSSSEVIRCIHTGLLCVQEDAALRPTMATVVLMLSSSSITLPFPSAPAFFSYTREMSKRDTSAKTISGGYDNRAVDFDTSTSKPYISNKDQITNLYPR